MTTQPRGSQCQRTRSNGGYVRWPQLRAVASKTVLCRGLFGLWLNALLVIPQGLFAQPSVRVMARTKVAVTHTEGSDLVELSTALLDGQGQPLAGQPLEVDLVFADGARQESKAPLVTDATGRAYLRLPERTLDKALVRYRGNDYYLQTHSSWARTSAWARSRVKLGSATTELDLDEPEQRLDLHLMDPPPQAKRPLRVTLTAAEGKTMAEAVLEDEAGLTLSVPSAQIAPGPLRMRATVWDGSGAILAETSRAYLARLQPQLDMVAASPASGPTPVLTGRLQTSRGPLGGKQIVVEAKGTPLLTIPTDTEGRFEHALSADELERVPAGTMVFARFEEDDSGLYPATSSSVSWPARPLAERFRWLPWGLAGLTFGLLLFLRRSARPRNGAQPKISAEAPQRGLLKPPSQPAIAPRYELGGRLIDGGTKEPIVGARVALLREGQALWSMLSTADGRFESPQLAEGTYTLHVVTPNHMEEHHEVHCPHQGEHMDMVLAMVNVRDAVWQSFRSAATRLTEHAGGAQGWPSHGGNPPTPREVAQWSAEQRNFSLRDLALAVEQVLFGESTPSPATASRLQEALKSELGEAILPETKGADPQGR